MRFLVRWFAIGCLLFHSQAIQAQPSPDTTPTLSDAIPFQLRSGFLILVEGRIGPLTPLKFILDTGATSTIVDIRTADKLSLPRQNQEGKLLNFDRHATVQWTNLPELQLGPLHARDVHVMVSDLKQFSEFAEGVDAIIGLDVLRTSQSLRIDYDTNLIAFKTPVAYVPANSGNATALIVRLPVQGQVVRLIVDTGLQGMLLYSDRVRNHAPQLKLTEKITQAYVGRLSGEQAKLTGIHFGSDELQASVFLIPKAPESLPANIDGFFGTTILHTSMIELDFASNTIRWQ
jgi:predicted aspartyl protease